MALSVADDGTTKNYAVTTSGATWLSVAPAAGATPGTLFVNVDQTGLSAGTYKASVTVSTASGSSYSQTIPVTLTVTNTGTTPCPAPSH